MASQVLYSDNFGDVLDRPEAGLIEIRWFDSTANLTSSAFNEWLAGFASIVEEAKRPFVLVDATGFRMEMAKMDGDWRDENYSMLRLAVAEGTS